MADPVQVQDSTFDDVVVEGAGNRFIQHGAEQLDFGPGVGRGDQGRPRVTDLAAFYLSPQLAKQAFSRAVGVR